MGAGASVTLENADFCLETEFLQRWECDLDPGSLMYPLVHEGHSALTMASKHRHKEVVDLLIQNGVDVWLRVKNDNSALRECLYCLEECIFLETKLTNLDDNIVVEESGQEKKNRKPGDLEE
jgi:hypothetical protein